MSKQELIEITQNLITESHSLFILLVYFLLVFV